MDTTPTTQTTHISLCSGYGGIDLGLKRCIPGLRTVAYAEIEAFAIDLLLARMEGGQLDAAPIWPDLRSFPWESFRDRVDILSGGYPCQPFSSAGKRLGADDERHLWPAIATGIRILRPRVCFFENVEGHITLGLREVVDELGAMGYRATWGIFSASEVGAPHQRKRVFILAHDTGETGRRLSIRTQQKITEFGFNGETAWPSRPGESQHRWEPPRVVGSGAEPAVGDAEGVRVEGRQHDHASGDRSGEGAQKLSGTSGGATECRETESEVGRGADGVADWMGYAELCVSSDNRTDELRLLGNGVVPATAAKAFTILMHELMTSEQVAKQPC